MLFVSRKKFDTMRVNLLIKEQECKALKEENEKLTIKLNKLQEKLDNSK